MAKETRNRVLALLLLASSLGCSTAASVESPEALVCPELGGNADLLELSYSDDPRANGRIKAFVASARGLADAVMEMERLAIDACDHMRDDLAIPPPGRATSVTQACDPVRSVLERTLASGIEIRLALVSPSCGTNAAREARCSSLCAASSSDCSALCKAQGALYAACTLPAVSVAVSRETAETLRLAQTLEQNMPALLYAEMALGKRLVGHAGTLVALSASLPNDVSHAGPRGIACAALAATLIGKAAGRLNGTASASARATLLLYPEVYPATRKSL